MKYAFGSAVWETTSRQREPDIRPHHFGLLDMLDWHHRHWMKLRRGLCCRFATTLGDSKACCWLGRFALGQVLGAQVALEVPGNPLLLTYIGVLFCLTTIFKPTTSRAYDQLQQKMPQDGSPRISRGGRVPR
uniref:Uncharacterized protein n=1 Tax=Eutreptiella gymnastica TaxID=73025 RepID=A0A7S4FTC4_9EUGL